MNTLMNVSKMKQKDVYIQKKMLQHRTEPDLRLNPIQQTPDGSDPAHEVTLKPRGDALYRRTGGMHSEQFPPEPRAQLSPGHVPQLQRCPTAGKGMTTFSWPL
ncbi:hypothetical protein ACOMHN_036939 [Nucella lapillus]